MSSTHRHASRSKGDNFCRIFDLYATKGVKQRRLLVRDGGSRDQKDEGSNEVIQAPGKWTVQAG